MEHFAQIDHPLPSFARIFKTEALLDDIDRNASSI
jgi:hypothetical protein